MLMLMKTLLASGKESKPEFQLNWFSPSPLNYATFDRKPLVLGKGYEAEWKFGMSSKGGDKVERS